MTDTGTGDVQMRALTATWCALLVSLVLGCAALGCGPTLSDMVRREAHAYSRDDPYSRDDLRLDCEPAEMEVLPFRRRSGALSAEDVARYSREGSIYIVYCPGADCCDSRDPGGVAVFCTRGASCSVVGDSLGRCGEIGCAPF